ncbi:MAG: HAMP domain-containing sensor histidine kinase [bacterium]
MKNKNCFLNICDKLNFTAQCKEARVGLWSCPPVIFMIVGAVDILVTIIAFFVAQNWSEPGFVFAGLGAINIIILTVGVIIMNAQEKIIENSKMRSEFVNVASHQLRAPLANIKWVLELFLSSKTGQMSEKQVEYAEIIQENNERMIKLVNDLLSVSKINEGKIKIEPKEFFLGHIAKQIISEYEIFAKARNVEVVFFAEDALPSVFADPERIKIAAQNLLDNAIKYAKKRGKVEVSIKKLKNHLVFAIKDNGVGIPERQKKHIFEKFFRSDNVLKHEVIGTGLGLFITKAIIESNKGKIWFESQEGKGTEFYFTVPFAD